VGFSKKSMPKEIDLSLFVDYDHVCLTLPEYKELLQSQLKLNAIERAYKQLESYEYDKILAVFFGPKGGGKDA